MSAISNLSCLLFFYGRYGQDVVNSTRLNNESMRGIDNQSTAVLRRWRNEGDQTDIPRALYGEGYNTLALTALWKMLLTCV